MKLKKKALAVCLSTAMVMTASGCGEKKDFFDTMEESSQIKNNKFNMELSFQTDELKTVTGTDTVKVKLTGQTKTEKKSEKKDQTDIEKLMDGVSGNMNVSVNYDGEKYVDVTDIIIKDNTCYLNAYKAIDAFEPVYTEIMKQNSDASETASQTYPGSALKAMLGKEYVKVTADDLKDMTITNDIDKIKNLFDTDLKEAIRKSNPAILGSKGDMSTFTINKSNAGAFVDILTDFVTKNQKDLNLSDTDLTSAKEELKNLEDSVKKYKLTFQYGAKLNEKKGSRVAEQSMSADFTDSNSDSKNTVAKIKMSLKITESDNISVEAPKGAASLKEIASQMGNVSPSDTGEYTIHN